MSVFTTSGISGQVSRRFTTIGIRAMASKTPTTTKFDVQKFDGKSTCVEDTSNVAVREEGTHKVLLGIDKKPSKMDDDEWNDIDFSAKATIILCLSDEILCNIMNEETVVGLWCGWRAFT